MRSTIYYTLFVSIIILGTSIAGNFVHKGTNQDFEPRFLSPNNLQNASIKKVLQWYADNELYALGLENSIMVNGQVDLNLEDNHSGQKTVKNLVELGLLEIAEDSQRLISKKRGILWWPGYPKSRLIYHGSPYTFTIEKVENFEIIRGNRTGSTKVLKVNFVVSISGHTPLHNLTGLDDRIQVPPKDLISNLSHHKYSTNVEFKGSKYGFYLPLIREPL